MMDIELLEKFLSGRCTEEEARIVREALSKDPEILEAYMREAATEAVAASMPVEMEKALLRNFPKKRRMWWPAAAAAAVVGIIIYGWFFSSSHDYVVLEAGAGGIKQVQLPDRSTIWLKPGSRLSFDQKSYGGKERLIKLEQGEAFFDVVHNASSPFVVQTGRVMTTDVGTSFDINMASSGRVVVTVATGEVKLSHDQKELGHLLPGNEMCVVGGSGEFERRSVPSWMAYIWKENHIQLKNVAFSELAVAIQQLYGIRLQTAEERILKQTFTIQLNRQTSVDEVIKVICLFNQNNYRKKADSSYLIY